jgi:hypothetical protein
LALAATARQESWAVQKRIGEKATRFGVTTALKYWPWIFGQSRTAEDFNKPDQNYPSAHLYRLMKRKKFKEAETLLQVLNVANAGIVERGSKQLHNSLRKRGRVPRKALPYIVASGPSVNAVIRERVKKVGLGKSGWMQGAAVLGILNKFPKWVTRHGANGAAYFSPPGAKVILWVKNTMKYLADASHELRLVTSALTSRREKLEKQIAKTIEANFKKQRRLQRIR